MSTLFDRFKIVVLMRWVTAISFSIFLGVIALNYHSVGVVQEMNSKLRQGPLANLVKWHDVVSLIGKAENARYKFLSAHDAAAAADMKKVVAELEREVVELGESAVAVHKSIKGYEAAFNSIEAASDLLVDARKKLVTDRGVMESLVYELDDPGTLEEALNEFLVAEVSYFADKGKEQVNSVLVLLDRFVRDTAGKEQEGAFRKAIGDYRATFESIVAANANVAELSKTMEATVEQIVKAGQAGQDAADREAVTAGNAAEQKAISAQRHALVWTGAGVVVAVVLSVLFDLGFSRQVGIAGEGIDTLARGDLRFRFPTMDKSRNEIVQIMLRTNRMADNLAVLLKMVVERSRGIQSVVSRLEEVKGGLLGHAEEGQQLITEVTEMNVKVDDCTQVVYNLSEANEKKTGDSETTAHEFSSIVNTVAAASEQASVNVTTMAAAAEEMTANVSEVNVNLERVSSSISMVAAAIEELDASLAEVRKRCAVADAGSRKAGGQVEAAGGSLGRLDGAANEIGKVVDVIKQIADQTNMLALNASIEAAGAGEAGKGFAVVANEVKELAKQTANATKMIGEKIQDIQKVVKEVRRSMGGVVEEIGQVMSITAEITVSVDEQSRASREIASSMGSVTQSTNAVSANASELSKAVEEVARAAAEAASGTTEIARSSNKAAVGAHQIVDNSTMIQKDSLAVKQKTHDIFAAAGQVQKIGLQLLDLMGELNGQSHTMAGLIGNLKEGAVELENSTKGFTLS